MRPTGPSPSHRSGGLYRLLESSAIYETVQRVLGAEGGRRRFAREFVRPRDGGRLLEIGCGAGGLLPHLPPGIKYVGYDLNPRYIEQARRLHGHRGEFRCARVEEPPADIGRFDVVVAAAILHHLDDPAAERLVRSAKDHLAPGGRLVTLDLLRWSGQPLLGRLLNALDRGRRVRTEPQYRALLGNGFGAVETYVLHDLARLPASHLIMRASVS
jgi:SAM-dependent methyltransferase